MDFNVAGGRGLVQHRRNVLKNLAPRRASSHVPAQSSAMIEVVTGNASSR